jgi:hypothetical protein
VLVYSGTTLQHDIAATDAPLVRIEREMSPGRILVWQFKPRMSIFIDIDRGVVTGRNEGFLPAR